MLMRDSNDHLPFLEKCDLIHPRPNRPSMILPLLGIWVMVSTLRAGLAHQRLARIIKEDGMELDVSSLPRMPSGRIQRDAADALFESVRGELASDPDDWRQWYRLARAYDYAGDRSRAREAMRKAVEMEERR